MVRMDKEVPPPEFLGSNQAERLILMRHVAAALGDGHHQDPCCRAEAIARLAEYVASGDLGVHHDNAPQTMLQEATDGDLSDEDSEMDPQVLQDTFDPGDVLVCRGEMSDEETKANSLFLVMEDDTLRWLHRNGVKRYSVSTVNVWKYEEFARITYAGSWDGYEGLEEDCWVVPTTAEQDGAAIQPAEDNREEN